MMANTLNLSKTLSAVALVVCMSAASMVPRSLDVAEGAETVNGPDEEPKILIARVEIGQ